MVPIKLPHLGLHARTEDAVALQTCSRFIYVDVVSEQFSRARTQTAHMYS